jgi:hypothetical protein
MLGKSARGSIARGLPAPGKRPGTRQGLEFPKEALREKWSPAFITPEMVLTKLIFEKIGPDQKG